MIIIGFFSSGDDMTLINYTSVHKQDHQTMTRICNNDDRKCNKKRGFTVTRIIST